MAIPYSMQPAPAEPQAGFGAVLALAPTRGLTPHAPSMTMPVHPGASPVFDPRAFLPPINPNDFEVQPLISIADIIGYVRKRWLRGAFLGLLLGAFVFYYLGMGVKIYEAEAQLLLRIQDGNVFNFDSMASRGVTELSAPQLFTLFIWTHSEWQRARQRQFNLPINGHGLQFALYEEVGWKQKEAT